MARLCVINDVFGHSNTMCESMRSCINMQVFLLLCAFCDELAGDGNVFVRAQLETRPSMGLL